MAFSTLFRPSVSSQRSLEESDHGQAKNNTTTPKQFTTHNALKEYNTLVSYTKNAKTLESRLIQGRPPGADSRENQQSRFY